MVRARIMIADTDISYILSLQLKFIEEFFEKIDLEIITDKEYLENIFSTPQKAEILIISEELYDSPLRKHNIGNVFLMTEQYEEDQTEDFNVSKIFKYTSINEIFNKIIGKSAELLNDGSHTKKESQIVVVTSAAGGVGKTTVAMGLSACLASNYKKVLYLNADRLQTFQHMLQNTTPITAGDIYTKLSRAGENIYHDIKHLIRNEKFNYIPPFKAPLMSLGIPLSVFYKLVAGAKKSHDYDFIVIDADTVFDEEKIKLIQIADKVIILTKQTKESVFATKVFVENINGIHDEKYCFVCNDFDKSTDNALISPDVSNNFIISHYIGHFQHYQKTNLENISSYPDIQKMTFLVM